MDSLRNIPDTWPDGVSAKGKFTRKTPGCGCLSEASVWNLAPKRERKRLKDVLMPVYIEPTNSGICGILSTRHYIISESESSLRCTLSCACFASHGDRCVSSLSAQSQFLVQKDEYVGCYFSLHSVFLLLGVIQGKKPHLDVFSLFHPPSS